VTAWLQSQGLRVDAIANNTATVPNTYTVTVTAMEGNVSHSQNVTLIAQ